MSNVQKSKAQVTCPPKPVDEPEESIVGNGVDFTVVEANYSALYCLDSIRNMRTCLRTWHLHFVGYNPEKSDDAYYYLELDRLIGNVLTNCIFEENTRQGLRKVVREFFERTTADQQANLSEAVKIRQTLIEWFTHTMVDFENRYDSLVCFKHMETFNTLDAVLNLVIAAHEDGINLYAPADAVAAA